MDSGGVQRCLEVIFQVGIVCYIYSFSFSAAIFFWWKFLILI